jgi:ribonuclease HII
MVTAKRKMATTTRMATKMTRARTKVAPKIVQEIVKKTKKLQINLKPLTNLPKRMQNNLLQFEKKLWDKGKLHVAGVDEAGRGPLAGPMVVAAVIFDPERVLSSKRDKKYDQIKDSKLLAPKKRGVLSEFIIAESSCYSIVEVDYMTIDEKGIAYATRVGFRDSVEGLEHKPQHVLTDYFTIYEMPLDRQTNLVSGENYSISIAAASIIAKVYRDNIMVKMHEKYPEYGFHQHKGYGTKQHKDAIAKHGLCEIHRKSFKSSY